MQNKKNIDQDAQAKNLHRSLKSNINEFKAVHDETNLNQDKNMADFKTAYQNEQEKMKAKQGEIDKGQD